MRACFIKLSLDHGADVVARSNAIGPLLRDIWVKRANAKSRASYGPRADMLELFFTTEPCDWHQATMHRKRRSLSEIRNLEHFLVDEDRRITALFASHRAQVNGEEQKQPDLSSNTLALR